MKQTFFITLALLLFCVKPDVEAQQSNGFYYDVSNYYPQIAQSDISNILLQTSNPLGSLGNDYQRFYIHFSTVKKSTKKPYEYLVTGKTRVKGNITPFSGTATIYWAQIQADSKPEEVEAKELDGMTAKGSMLLKIVFDEDKAHSGSGK